MILIIKRTNLVSRKRTVDLDSLVKVIYDILLRIIVAVAVRFQGTDTGAVLVPFVFPEIWVVAFVVFPVSAHVVQ